MAQLPVMVAHVNSISRRYCRYPLRAGRAALGGRRFATSLRRSASAPPNEKTDVLIVGSGAAGLTAALRAHSLGLRALIVEKSPRVGGTSVISGGGLWIPGNHISRAAGTRDDRAEILKYMDAAVGDAGPASSPARRAAFVDHGPKMVAFLEDQGFRWRPTLGYPDYYPELPGGRPDGGRGVEGEIFNVKKLGAWRGLLNTEPHLIYPPFATAEPNRFMRMRSSWTEFWFSLRLIAKFGWYGLTGDHASLGRSLVAQLLLLNLRKDLAIWREAPLVDLVLDSDGAAVTGARVRQDGEVRTIRAERGVLLCAGGFTHNLALRQKWGPSPASTEWTVAQAEDTGDAVLAGIDAGAATALLDDAWWGAVGRSLLTGHKLFILADRARPFSMIVDASGRRFLNEAEPYTDLGHHVYERNKTVKAIPAWLVVDGNYTRRYALASVMPGMSLQKAVDNGWVLRSDTLAGLCEQAGIDAAGMRETVGRFNAMCRAGKDEDFGRGDSAYDRMFGDPAVGPNPNLGPLGRPPFYALALWPGDLGTKGGLLTDEAARVLREDGTAIPGLYAAGNTSASVMGRSYPGAGSTLGPALTFAYIAVNDMAHGAV